MSDVLITAGVGVRIPHGPYKKDTHSGVFFYGVRTGAILLKITVFESAVQNKLHCAFFCAKLNLCGNAIVGNRKIAFRGLE